MKIGVLYICTGRYVRFWKAFYKSCEQYLLAKEGYEKQYYVFTDAPTLAFEGKRVKRIFQPAMPWPYPTLYRYQFFAQIEQELQQVDALYFFNANALFVSPVDEAFLPTHETPLTLMLHPGFCGKPRSAFTYEINPLSAAYVEPSEGSHYFMGSVNGGLCNAYLSMVKELARRIQDDERKGLIATWHDESHLNRYAIEHAGQLKILPPSYGYPEEMDRHDIKPQVILRNKGLYGGKRFMRSKNRSLTYFFKVAMGALARIFQRR